MSSKNAILVVIAIAALGGAGFLVMKNTSDSGPQEESLDRSEFFNCQECQHEFDMTMRAYARARAEGGNPECPECSSRKTTHMAGRCESCERNLDFVGHAGMPANCEHCGHKIGDWGANTEAAREFDEEVQGDGG